MTYAACLEYSWILLRHGFVFESRMLQDIFRGFNGAVIMCASEQN